MKKRLIALTMAMMMLCSFAFATGDGLSSMGLNGYNPASEEDTSSGLYGIGATGVYAGATPIPLDPIDMPTATPRPDLTFTYGEYTAAKMGVTFSAPVGWQIDDYDSSTYVLTEPAESAQDGYPCVITLTVSSITKNYQTSDIKTDLSNYLKILGSSYETWETWTPASKKMLGGSGYYNNYRGVTSSGAVIRGRVHMAIVSNYQLLTLHITCPGWFNSSYMKVYDNIIKTLKLAQ